MVVLVQPTGENHLDEMILVLGCQGDGRLPRSVKVESKHGMRVRQQQLRLVLSPAFEGRTSF